MSGVGGGSAVEDIPVPQLPIASQVKLASADSANWHADVLKVRAAIYGGLPALGQRSYPFGPELLVRGHEFIKVRPAEWAGHRPPRSQCEDGCACPERLQKIAPIPISLVDSWDL